MWDEIKAYLAWSVDPDQAGPLCAFLSIAIYIISVMVASALYMTAALSSVASDQSWVGFLMLTAPPVLFVRHEVMKYITKTRAEKAKREKYEQDMAAHMAELEARLQADRELAEKNQRKP